jgi:hypothetical protein
MIRVHAADVKYLLGHPVVVAVDAPDDGHEVPKKTTRTTWSKTGVTTYRAPIKKRLKRRGR